jgi:hypothetical protein
VFEMHRTHAVLDDHQRSITSRSEAVMATRGRSRRRQYAENPPIWRPSPLFALDIVPGPTSVLAAA